MNDIMEKKKKVILELMNDKTYIPMKFKELAVVLNITKENRDQLEEVLSELLEERKISITKKGKYVITKEHYIEGYFISNDRGFGFVEVEGQDEDYFIPVPHCFSFLLEHSLFPQLSVLLSAPLLPHKFHLLTAQQVLFPHMYVFHPH